MISAPDRRRAVELIDEAYQAGARKRKACEVVHISIRTYQRWSRGEDALTDGRPQAKRPVPANKLCEEERERVLEVCHEPGLASLPPSQIVPRLADERGDYIASESTFYRVLKEADEQHHRGRSAPRGRPKPPASYCATGPCQVWSWDITWLPGPIKGLFFYLYLILDVFSRKIVGWEVFEQELSAHAAKVIRRAVWAENCIDHPLVLHADNGGPMKGSTMRVTLENLGVTASFSRPRVSNDNPYSEALFRTCKYRPDYPEKAFGTLSEARDWVLRFVRWYNHEHRHSAIRFVTPHERHEGLDQAILERRREIYEQARTAHPERWTRRVRNWEPVDEVWLNPETCSSVSAPDQLIHAA
jgi:transposase InsO family protein